MATQSLVLGTDENYFDFTMQHQLRSEHLHIVGATGSGKSRFLLSLILQDIQQRRGLCLIDPHGELVDHILDWLGKNKEIADRRTIRLLDLKDREWSFGFNPLGTDDPERLEATVDQAVSAIASVMGGDDLSQTPLLRLSLNAVCIALASAGLTLNEAPYLLKPDYPEERLAITNCITNPTYRHVWDGLNSLATNQPKLYTEQFQAAERRFVPFIANRFVRSILGQSANTLDLKSSMDEGEILLVDLSREGGLVPPESSKIIGRLIVNNLVARAYERPPRTCRPFNLYIDEVQNYLSGDVPEILSQCRKFGLHLTIAHQYLQQLREAGELTYHGVMGTARNKVVFALDNPEDAEIMQRRILVGQYDFERPKESLIKPTVVGHEIVRLWSEGISENASTTATKGQNTTSSIAEAQGFSEGVSQGTSTGSGTNTGDAITIVSGEALDVSQQSTSISNMVNDMSGSSLSSSSSRARGQSEGQSSSTGQTKGQGTNRGYSESLRPIFQHLPTAVYSLEEQKHIFTDAVISLPKRTAFAVIPSIGFAKIKTLDVPDLFVAAGRKQRLLHELKASSAIHKLAPDIQLEIQSRFNEFMTQSRQGQSTPEAPPFDPLAPLDEEFEEPPSFPT